MGEASRYALEVLERAVRIVFEHESEYASLWAAVSSIAGKRGCLAETLRSWVRRAETDQGYRESLTDADRERLKALEKGSRELKRANEILKTASAFSPKRRNALAETILGLFKAEITRGRGRGRMSKELSSRLWIGLIGSTIDDC